MPKYEVSTSIIDLTSPTPASPYDANTATVTFLNSYSTAPDVALGKSVPYLSHPEYSLFAGIWLFSQYILQPRSDHNWNDLENNIYENSVEFHEPDH